LATSNIGTLEILVIRSAIVTDILIVVVLGVELTAFSFSDRAILI
jgi:hypothetical protein